MDFEQITTELAEVTYSVFQGRTSIEYNVFFSPVQKGTMDRQLMDLQCALSIFMHNKQLTNDTIAFERFFVSDFTNQSEMLKKADVFGCNCAVSIVQQAPLNGKKVGLWVSFLQGTNGTIFQKETSPNKVTMTHNNYTHVYTTQMHSSKANDCSYDETTIIFDDYLELLKGHNLTLQEHCIRTWFYVRDIDNNYAGMVTARNEVFDSHQLTKETHFIASTGIEGRFDNPAISVLMDAYAIGGIKPEQISFLKAATHLNPTHEYGVAFERGTAVDYGDRRQIVISGTASIDNLGDIVHVGDITGQTDRAFENVESLLKEADATMNDISSLIVYLRDVADYEEVNCYMEKYYAKLPHIIVLAPVCRPGWLIEIECIAIKATENTNYNCF